MNIKDLAGQLYDLYNDIESNPNTGPAVQTYTEREIAARINDLKGLS